MLSGMIKVKKPNTRLLFRFALNSFISSSRPAINMMYNKPMVENKLMAEFFSSMFRPSGPMITPEMIKPIIPGIFSFFNTMGESRMINRISEKINIGFCKGNLNSDIRWLKKSVIN